MLCFSYLLLLILVKEFNRALPLNYWPTTTEILPFKRTTVAPAGNVTLELEPGAAGFCLVTWVLPITLKQRLLSNEVV